jgi:hypothetical protein
MVYLICFTWTVVAFILGPLVGRWLRSTTR